MQIHHLPPIEHVRYEVKFVTEPQQLPGLLAWLRTHRSGWHVDFPDRTVNNVYFDTPTLTAYDENQAGISERRKLRYRWYGDTWQPERGTVEVKCRSGGVGWKWAAHVDQAIDLDHGSWQRCRDQLRANLPPLHRFLLDERPLVALVNRYERSYFLSRDGRLRLTIDQAICFYPQLGRSRPALRHAAHRANAMVVEVKCAVDDKGLTADALRDMPLRVSRHSKYAMGVESLENL